MGKLVKIEEKGRVLLPKKLREELRLRIGQRLLVQKDANQIILKPVSYVEDIMTDLRGCIKEPSEMKPEDVKKMWEKNV